MKVCVLSSGSKGNVTYIGTNKANLLIDLGPTCSYVEESLKSIGVNPKDIDAILITHTHSDHIKGLAVFLKKYNPMVYLSSSMKKDLTFDIKNYTLIEDDFKVEDIMVRVIKTSHDTEDSNGYILENKDTSVVQITDTGFINERYFKLLSNRTIYIMESNHDIEMLLNGKYPYQLKRRVLSDRGHLSNIDCANYLSRFIGPKTKEVILAHLSEENNTEEVALNTLYGVLEEHNISFSNVKTAKQNKKTEVILL